MAKRLQIAKILVLFFVLNTISCRREQKEQIENVEDSKQILRPVDFGLLQNFEHDTLNFKKEVFPLDDFSTEGGELVIFSSDTDAYRIYDFWLYGETGKLHYTYWTDTINTFRFARRELYNYDRPNYEKGFQIHTVINYLSYEENLDLLYGKDQRKINNQNEIQTVREDLASFFSELTVDID